MEKTILNVKSLNQNPELPTGCEITAVTMLLNYKGVEVDKCDLARKMPRDRENPNIGYVGNPFLKSGWTIYPKALVNVVESYAGTSVDLTGTSLSELEKKIEYGSPVVVWVKFHEFTVHALLIVGFDKEHVYYNDPWTGEKSLKIRKCVFEELWKMQDKRALSC